MINQEKLTRVVAWAFLLATFGSFISLILGWNGVNIINQATGQTWFMPTNIGSKIGMIAGFLINLIFTIIAFFVANKTKEQVVDNKELADAIKSIKIQEVKQ